MANPTTEPPKSKPAPTFTLVQVNKAGSVHLQAGYQHEGEGEKRKTSFSPEDLFCAIPGFNFVPTTLWEKAKTNDTVKTLLAEKVPRLKPPYVQENAGQPMIVEGETVPVEAPLSKLSETRAIEVAQDVLMVEFPEAGRGVDLVTLLKTEQRPKVQRAIQDQIDAIRKAQSEGRSPESLTHGEDS